MRLYKKFWVGVPEYLARYYGWAYLWRGSLEIFLGIPKRTILNNGICR